ncbi:unnamed protein product, partial [Leptidea sinapis]
MKCDTRIVCGVCQKNVSRKCWLRHIKNAHNYLAWIEGETPLDINDENAVYNHLSAINEKIPSGLLCQKMCKT